MRRTYSSTVECIFEIVQSYAANRHNCTLWQKFVALFGSVVEKQVNTGSPVRFCLPAFPCKSPNRSNKVVGSRPDLGEELALAHLNSICENIKNVYEGGAELLITSDGAVYNGT
jgi:pyoverdine/dityrosine biosynthesis protein Dit1